MLELLGYRPDDEVHDLFAGSGAVTFATELYELPPAHQCAACGAPIEQRSTGRPRRTCSDACRRRHAPTSRPGSALVGSADEKARLAVVDAGARAGVRPPLDPVYYEIRPLS